MAHTIIETLNGDAFEIDIVAVGKLKHVLNIRERGTCSQFGLFPLSLNDSTCIAELSRLLKIAAAMIAFLNEGGTVEIWHSEALRHSANTN